jgi:YVTN family beta-propeller protein
LLFLAIATVLTLQNASASPGTIPSDSSATPRPTATPRPGRRTPTPAASQSPSPTPTPTRGPAGKLIVVDKSDNAFSILDTSNGKLVATAPTDPGPHEVVVLADGKTAAISVYGSKASPGRKVMLIDAATGQSIATVDIGERSRPHGLDALRDGRLLVTSEGTRELAIVDPKTAKVVKRLPTERDVSHMVASSPDGKRAYVTSIAAGALTVLDLMSGKVIADIATGKGAEGVAVTPDGREVWVTNRQANTISVVDANALKAVFAIEAGEFPIRVKFTPDGARAIVSFTGSGDIGVFDRAKRALIKRIPLGRDAVAGTQSRVFQNRFGTSPAPVGIFVAPDGRRAWIAASHADIVSVINLDELKVEDAWAAGKEPDGLAGVFPSAGAAAKK